MIKSMTGYGRGECALHDRRFTVEIKAVNHRYGDITVKLPRVMNPFEERVRKRLSRTIQRGKADVFIGFESYAEQDVTVSVNTVLADAYHGAFVDMQKRFGLNDDISLSLMADLPDIFTVNKKIDDEAVLNECWQALSGALEAALGHFDAMREREGQNLRTDLMGKKERLTAALAVVRTRVPDIAAEYAARLRERITAALADAAVAVDEQRILTEVAFFADKACIDEEITRLESHLSQFGAILSDGDASCVGRKLDFLVQEINREVNTIGSKANDVTLTQLVLEMKSETEKIREQVQNIE